MEVVFVDVVVNVLIDYDLIPIGVLNPVHFVMEMKGELPFPIQ